MRHGFSKRRLQGSSSKRHAVMRSLVSSLLHHESIKTTMAKAKVAQQMAEKVITWGKRNTEITRRKAQRFLRDPHVHSPAGIEHDRTKPGIVPLAYPNLDPSADPETFQPPKSILPKVFETLRERYKDRAGGYTRIHHFGRRQGDNAPHAILELVDGPRDVKFEITARSVAMDLFRKELESGKGGATSDIKYLLPTVGLETWKSVLPRISKEKIDKALGYRAEADVGEFEEKVRQWGYTLITEHEAARQGHRLKELKPKYANQTRKEVATAAGAYTGERLLAGEVLPLDTVTRTGLGVARGALGRLALRRGDPKSQQQILIEAAKRLRETASSAKPASAENL